MNFEFFIAKKTLSSSKRIFTKTIFKVALLAVSIGVATMILSVSIVNGFKSEIQNKLVGFAGAVQIVKYNMSTSVENTFMELLPSDSVILNNDKQIIHYQSYINKAGIVYVNNEIEGIVLKGIYNDFSWDFYNDKIIEGHKLNITKDSVSNEIMLSRYTANRLSIKAGDDVIVYFVQEPIKKRRLKVVGIFDIGIEELDKMYALCDLRLIQKINGWHENQVGGYEVFIKDNENIDTFNTTFFENINRGLASYSIKERYPSIFDWLSLLDANSIVMFILMISVACINMISVLLILILERTQMIGLFKALGANNWSIRKIFLINASYIISKGLFLGNIIGLGLGFIQNYFKIVKLDQESYYMSYVPILIDWQSVLFINIGTFIICVLSLIIPSILVSKITPVKALSFK